MPEPLLPGQMDLCLHKENLQLRSLLCWTPRIPWVWIPPAVDQMKTLPFSPFLLHSGSVVTATTILLDG